MLIVDFECVRITLKGCDSVSTKKFTPPLPNTEPPNQEVVESLQKMTKKERKALLKDPRIKKYTGRIKEREKQFRRSYRSEWWWSKGIQIANLILALIAAITGIIALLR